MPDFPLNITVKETSLSSANIIGKPANKKAKTHDRIIDSVHLSNISPDLTINILISDLLTRTSLESYTGSRLINITVWIFNL